MRLPPARRLGVVLLASLLSLIFLPAATVRAATGPDSGGTLGSQRPLSAVFADVVIGDFQLIGNALLKCEVACDQNNTTLMEFLDADSNPTTYQSSSASFNVPDGAAVKYAYLSWTGYTNTKFPVADGADLLPVKVSVDTDQGYQPVYADPTRHGVVTQGGAQWLTAGADVTSILQGLTGTHEVWVADAPTFAEKRVNQAMGWGMTVVYEWPTADPSAGRVARQITVMEGFVTEQGSEPPTDVALKIPPIVDTNLVTMGLMAVEGDFGSVGDTFELGTSADNLTNIPEPQSGALNNFFVSYATGSTNPAGPYNQNVDAKTLDLPGILPAGTTTPFIRLKTGIEGYAINMVTFSAAVASLNLVKTADVEAYDSTDDTITYTFTVSNPTAVTITDVLVTDKLEGLGPITCEKAANGTITLASGESTDCTAEYQIQSTDLGASLEVVNNAIATGIDTSGEPITSDEVSVTVPCGNCSPAISLTKTVDPKVDYAGAEVTYTLNAKNTGNTVLSDVVITDPLPGLGAFNCTIDGKSTTNGAASLVPGQTMVCTAPYTLTEADEAAGSVANTATVTGTPPPGQPTVTDDASAVVGVQVDEFTVEKLVSVTGECADAAKTGEVTKPGTVTYCYTITNTGKTTITGLTAVDDLATPDDPSDDQPITLVSTTLAPGESTTGSLDVTIVQTQIENGVTLTNTVSVTTDHITDPVTDTAKVIAVQKPSFTINKRVTKGETCSDATESVEVSTPGQVTYCYTLTNTGNVTLTDLVALDDMATSDPTDDVLLSWDVDAVGPGGNAWTSLKVEISQAQIDAGKDVVNTVSATTDQTPDPMTDTATVTVTSDPSLTVVKTVSVTGDCADAVDISEVSKPGTVTYCYTVTNTGNITLTGVSAVDDMATPADPSDDLPITLESTTLAPGESTMGTLEVDLTQAQIDAGLSLTNTVGVTAEQIPDPTTDTATVTVDKQPNFTVTKKVTLTGNCRDAVKEVGLTKPGYVIYCYTITNTGNTTLTGITAVDDLATPDDPSDDVTIVMSPDTIAPGEAATGQLPVYIDEVALAGPAIVNTVTVTTDETGSEKDTDVATVVPVPEIHNKLPETGGGVGVWLYLVPAIVAIAVVGPRRRRTSR